MTTLSIDEFENLSGFIFRRTGIRFETQKIYRVLLVLNPDRIQ